MSTQTHWKKLTNPDYLGSWDFEPGQERVLTIDFVAREVVSGPDGKKEDCPVVHFTERSVKPMVLNHTNGKTISKVLESPIVEDWHGKRILLTVQKVKAFGEVVDAVRVKDKAVEPERSAEPLLCADCHNEITASNGFPAATIAAGAKKRYGVTLCLACGTKRKEKLEASAPEGSAPEETQEGQNENN